MTPATRGRRRRRKPRRRPKRRRRVDGPASRGPAAHGRADPVVRRAAQLLGDVIVRANSVGRPSPEGLGRLTATPAGGSPSKGHDSDDTGSTGHDTRRVQRGSPVGQPRSSTAHSAPRMKNGPNGTYVRRPIRRAASRMTRTTPASDQGEDHAAQGAAPAGQEADPDEQLHVADPERSCPERDGRQEQDRRDDQRGGDGQAGAPSRPAGWRRSAHRRRRPG